MQLADCEIKNAVQSDILRITPFNIDKIKSNSYDLRLGDEFTYYKDWFEIMEGKDGKFIADNYENDFVIDPYDKDSIEYEVERYVGETFIIKPRQFVLARTIEYIELPSSICAQVGGKSSIARLGSSIHQTAGFIDSGFKGTITLELFNANNRPIKLYAGMDIAQIMFMSGTASCRPYDTREHSKYSGQVHTQLSKYYLNDKPYQRITNG